MGLLVTDHVLLICLKSFNIVGKVVDKGKPIDVIYLDFQKAFDKVPHLRLMMKVEAHGIGGKVSHWIKN